MVKDHISHLPFSKRYLTITGFFSSFIALGFIE